MSATNTALVDKGKPDGSPQELEAGVQEWGKRIFSLMAAAEPPSFFSGKGLTGSLVDRALRDEHFKTQLFRFVDVLPALTTAEEITLHFKEYLDNEQIHLSPALRAGLMAAGGTPRLFSYGIKTQVAGLARQFIIADNEQEMVAALRQLHERGTGFTADLLGETVVSEPEAEVYAARCLSVLERLVQEVAGWPVSCKSNLAARGPVPALNLSVKISALYSQIHPARPEAAIEVISSRLRPILRVAAKCGAFINFDMESRALKDLTLDLFKSIFSEPEFERAPACGLALQAYLKESEADLADLINWSRLQHRRVTVRLVKGAYWDYENAVARQRGWPVPVFDHKAETDANFEKLSKVLLENENAVDAAFGTHNVRSIAHVLAQAERLGVGRRNFEFQMLRGMAGPVKAALLQLDCRLREYCPAGELIPGMAYLVRRLLENTSNEGFLARHFAQDAGCEALMRNPRELLASHGHATKAKDETEFHNEPPSDFTMAANRERMRAAIRDVRRQLSQHHPLIINHRPVETSNRLASLNPANRQEVIGYAAQATVNEADAAIIAARTAQPEWARQPANKRADLLNHLANLMRRDKFSLAALEILEAGKSWLEADADVAEAIDYCDFYAAEMCRLGSPQMTRRTAGETNFQEWLPRGVGVVIAPWNFPLAILTGMTTAAIVTGNAVIMKPSNETPAIASRLMKLMMEAGFPPGVANLVTGPGDTIGSHLVAHPAVDFIAFTGSKEAGLKIWETAGHTAPGQKNLKKVVCEMGGKNCVIVDVDADLDEAVTGCLASAFGYQGQKCSALSRLIVLARNHDRFMKRFIAAADSMRIGPAEVPDNFLGPVISRAAQKRLLAIIESGKTGATLAWQGRVPDDANACYVPPAIFTEVPPGSRLFREEIFGPVLAITKAGDFDEALALANSSEFALTAGCYSRSPAHIERVKQELMCGNLYINRSITGAVVERQPFGGFRMSGAGTKAGGRDYLHHFMVPRVVTENCLRHGFAPAET